MATTHHSSASPAVSYGGRNSPQGWLIFTVQEHGKLGLWLGRGAKRGLGWPGGSPDLSWCRRGSQGARESWGEPPCLISSAFYRRPRLPHHSGRNSEAKLDSTLFLTSNPSATFLLLLPLDGCGFPLLPSIMATILIRATSSVPCDVLPLLGGMSFPTPEGDGQLALVNRMEQK